MAIIPGSSPTLPANSLPYGTQQYKAPDGSIWVGTSANGYFEVGKDIDVVAAKAVADSANAKGDIAQEDIEDIETVQLPLKQDKTDNNLTTPVKTIVGAINQLNSTVNEISLFLAAGQSNAFGSSEGLTNSPTPLDGTFKYYGGQIVPCADPVSDGGSGSAWPAFANAYRSTTGEKICIVSAAVGGTALVPAANPSLPNWSPSSTLFTASITKLNAAKTALEALGYKVNIKGVLWSQGESDGSAINSATITATQYHDALVALITRYKTTINSNIVFGIFRTGVYQQPFFDIFFEVRRQQEIVSSEVVNAPILYRANINFFERGLMKDNEHYLQIGYNEMGAVGAFELISRANQIVKQETKAISNNVNYSPIKGSQQFGGVISNTNAVGFSMTHTVDQSSTAQFIAYLLSVYIKAQGSGNRILMSLGTNPSEDGTGLHNELFRVETSGKVKVYGNIEPDGNNTRNLGSGGGQWAGVYVAIVRAIASIAVQSGAPTSGILFRIGDTTEVGRFAPTTGNFLIGTNVDDAKSILTTPVTDAGVISTAKGSLPYPRMTQVQKLAIPTPTFGLMVTDSTLKSPAFYDGTVWQPVFGTGVTTSGPTFIMDVTREIHIFLGSTGTWTAPVLANNTWKKLFIKNRGSGNLTINSNGGANDFYLTSALNTLTVAAGAAIILINDGTYWTVN